MSNTFKTTSWMAKETLRHFETSCTLPKHVSKHYAKEYTNAVMRPGTTISIPKPARFAVTSGATASFPDITEESVDLTVAQYNTSFAPTSIEMTTAVSKDQFSERYLKPMAIALASKVDTEGYAAILTKVWNAVGTPATAPTAVSTALDGKAKIKLMSAPKEDLAVVLNPQAEAKLLDAMKGLLNPQSDIAKQYQSGNLGMAYGMKWNADELVGTRTVGTQGGTPLIDGASQVGASILTKGWSNSITNVIRAGDIFTIAGVYSVNPVTKVSTGVLQQFVVTANANSGASTGPATISISPSIVISGTTQTVSGSPADNAALTVLGASAVISATNLIFHRDALTLACIPMQTYGGLDKSAVEYDSDTGIAIRFTQGMDVTNDKLLVRADVLFGWAVPRPEWACRVEG